MDSEQRQGGGCRIRIENGQMWLNPKQLKSFEILKATVTVITCNTKLMWCMILSVIPLFSFMLFFDIKLQKLILATPELLQYQSPITYVFSTWRNQGRRSISSYRFLYDYRLGFLSELLQVCVLWSVLYPLLETFSMIVTVRGVAKVHAGENQVTLKDALSHDTSLKGLSVTCICVQLLSNLTLLGLFWIIANSRFLTDGSFFTVSPYEFNPVEFGFIVLHIAIYSALFIGLFYKYLDWSAFWNTSMVVSVLGEETGLKAFGMADYYGKHSKKTGLQLTLVLFASSTLPRVLCLFAGLCKANVVGVVIVVFSVGLFCLGNLVKSVAFVLYFYDCKQQTMEKKADEEVRKVENGSNTC